MKFFNASRNNSTTSTAVASHNNSFEADPATVAAARNGTANGNSLTTDPEKARKHSVAGSGIGKGGRVPGVTLRTCFMALLVAMGGFVFGYDTGQISGFLQMDVFLRRFGQYSGVSTSDPSGYKFSNVRSGLIVGLLSIGTLIGAVVAGPVANKIGRRLSIPPWCLVFCIGVVVQMSVGQGMWVGIAMGRLVAGLGVGALSVLVPLYMSETSPVPVRGAVISCYQLFITFGIFIADAINYGTKSRMNIGAYEIPMGIGYIWVLILGFGILLLPETPRFDWNHNRQDRARDTMSKFYGIEQQHPLIERETSEIEKVRLATQGDHPWYEAITGPRMFYRVALGMTLQMLQQLTGANYFFYYGTTIFRGVGIKDPFVTAMILGGVNFGSTFLGVYMARHCRRRESMYIAALWQAMCFFVFASVGQFVFKDTVDANGDAINPHLAHTSGVVMIVFACLFIFGYAITWGPLVWACVGEMFPYKYRAVGMGLATSANWFWNFMIAFFTPFITNDIQYAYGYVFAGCNLAAFFIVYFFLIESSGRTLEEVDAMYLLHVSPRKSAHYVFDEQTLRDLSSEINTDAMHLQKSGRGGFRKEDEAPVGGVLHNEGGPATTSASSPDEKQ